MILLNLESKNDIYFLIALFSNRIIYWLWNVICDGFHVTKTFVKKICNLKSKFSNNQYLIMVDYGREYMDFVCKEPKISYNSGKKIISYNYEKALDYISSKIEKLIISVFNINLDFEDYIVKWYQNHIICGRE